MKLQKIALTAGGLLVTVAPAVLAANVGASDVPHLPRDARA